MTFINKKLGGLLAMLALMVSALPASAATVYLVSPNTDVVVGQTYQFELWTADFGPSVMSVGGGVDAFYDPSVMSLVGWTDTSGSLLPMMPTDLFGQVNGIQVDTGILDWLPVGATQSGILEFAISPTAPLGLTSITLAENIFPVGGFFAAVPVSFSGLSLNVVDLVPVPVPGGLLLMSSALALVGLRRRQGQRSGS